MSGENINFTANDARRITEKHTMLNTIRVSQLNRTIYHIKDAAKSGNWVLLSFEIDKDIRELLTSRGFKVENKKNLDGWYIEW